MNVGRRFDLGDSFIPKAGHNNRQFVNRLVNLDRRNRERRNGATCRVAEIIDLYY